jgi:hypothetical protein
MSLYFTFTSHFTGASKQYYVSAAPQCPYPDASLGSALNTAYFDMVYVQFCTVLVFQSIFSEDIKPKYPHRQQPVRSWYF